MNVVAFLGAIEIGLIFGLVSVSVFLSFRVLNFPDLTVDGSFPLGAAVGATLIVDGIDPYLATAAAIVAGGAAGLTMVEASLSKSSDVLAAAQSLVGKVDVIYVPNDNTAVAALESILKVGIDNKIPVYAGDTDSVKRGAIATLGFNYLDVGRQAGRIVVRVLKGMAVRLQTESGPCISLLVF